MAIRLKDLTKGSLDSAWLNRIIKSDPTAQPREKGEKDKDFGQRGAGEPYLPKRRRKGGA